MQRYKVSLEFVDVRDNSRNTEFAVTVEALNGEDAIAKGRAIHQCGNQGPYSEKPWSWSFHETAEQG
jgi:hypothetical protein